MATSTAAPLQSLDRALEVLDLFVGCTEAGVREVSRLTGWNATTCYRILSTFAQRGYLVQDTATRRYRIGPRIHELASFQNHSTLTDVATAEMRRLRDVTGESISLHRLLAGWRICTLQVESTRELRWSSNVGRPMAVLWGASDRVFRAFCDATQIALCDEIVAELEAKGEYVPNRGENRDLETVRIKGWAATGTTPTRTPGAAAVAAPVFRDGAVQVLTVIGPESRLRDEQTVQAVVPELLRSATTLSDPVRTKSS